jgi:hypothetical protein
MNFHLGNDNEKGVHNKDAPPSNFFYFVVEVGPNPQSIESYTEKVFAGVGLRTKSSIKAFDRFMGQSFFRKMVNDAKNDPGISAAVKNPQGKIIEIKIRVFPSIVESLRRFGINLLTNSKGKTAFKSYAATFTKNVKKFETVKAAPETPISQWTTIQKLDSVIRRTALLLPEAVGNELMKLLEPLALAIMAAVIVIWAVSHFFGVGEIADVVLLILGIVSIGPMAWIAGEHLVKFAVGTVSAEKDSDLDGAAKNLSEAIALLGVQVVMLLLLKKAPKVLKDSKVLHEKPSVTPRNFRNIGEPPTSSKHFFENYEGNLSFFEHPFPGVGQKAGGSTSAFGDIHIIYAKTATFSELKIAVFHERVHQFLTPRLQVFKFLRQTSAILKKNSYFQSYILRYMEEALAETFAQVAVNGWRTFFIGIKFPVAEGYVSLAKIGVEAKGILLGPINVGGMTFNVYYNYQ